ncbi:ribonuclease P protein component [Patescibacteria group bacterium]|jgi:ribonuclease P protein component|nr:ribonuclease P protein component [Patescibacteria group bacterium]HPD07866.1 ribonuclease P protein component [bacterium]HRT11136.1 ribonuclease P protein component [Patescibacteria group bacterium]HRU89975.1 ribonuclease P protein component [Patescibacteria group bacterium]
MLKKQNRLTKKKDFDRLFRSAEAKYYGKLLGVRIVANGLDYNRFGFVVSRRYCHLAVERNLIRRRLATIVEENLSKMVGGHDIVIVVIAPWPLLKFIDLRQELINAWKKLKLIV